MLEKISDKYILVGGVAQPPKDTGVANHFGQLNISLYVNHKTHIVEDAFFNMISPLTQEYLRHIVIGYCMLDPIEPILDELRKSALISSSNTVGQAMKCAIKKYRSQLK